MGQRDRPRRCPASRVQGAFGISCLRALSNASNREILSAWTLFRQKSIQALYWEGRETEVSETDRYGGSLGDPISQNILALHLLDPSAHSFRPAGCKSAHDVLRYCHEKSVEAMFTVNDIELEQGARSVKEHEN